ncbi:hypothetical protein [Nocardia sp. NPDC051463]
MTYRNRLNAAAVVALSIEQIVEARDQLRAVCDLVIVTPREGWPVGR